MCRDIIAASQVSACLTRIRCRLVSRVLRKSGIRFHISDKQITAAQAPRPRVRAGHGAVIVMMDDGSP